MRCLWVNTILLLCQITIFLMVKYAVKNSFGNAGLCGWHEAEVFFLFWVFCSCCLSLIYSINSLHDLIISNSEGFANSKKACKEWFKNPQKFLGLFLINVRTTQATCGPHKENNPTSLFCYDSKHFSPLSDWSK